MKKPKRSKIQIIVPEGLTFEEEQEYIAHEIGIDYISTGDEVPADEDCEEIIEFEPIYPKHKK